MTGVPLMKQDAFLNPEVRCGYYVSDKMKKVWKTELDLLCRFIEVCEKYNLRYFADAGTLLGTIRHQGFIPWDDDIDVCMPREDYNKLFEVAEKEFSFPYFFQTALSEKAFYRTHAQLRYSLSTGFIPEDREKDINKGIFLDIFVLDGVADSALLRILHRYEIRFHEILLSYEYDRQYDQLSPLKKVVYGAVHLLHKLVPYKKHFDYYNRHVLARYSTRATRKIGNLELGWRPHTQWKREWFSDCEKKPFEDILINVPTGYHQILTTQYGDYMKIPEDVTQKNGRFHDTVTFEPDIPYTVYFQGEERKNVGKISSLGD